MMGPGAGMGGFGGGAAGGPGMMGPGAGMGGFGGGAPAAGGAAGAAPQGGFGRSNAGQGGMGAGMGGFGGMRQGGARRGDGTTPAPTARPGSGSNAQYNSGSSNIRPFDDEDLFVED